jgi:very-short-patch-repair endonuclease
MRLYNAPSSKPLRRALRAQLTPSEAALWKHLQRSQLDGRKFRRQHSVGPYVLDFYCPRERLAVELDGAAHDHASAQTRDRIRERFLMQAGIQVLRFENRHVIENLEGVLIEIKRRFSAD